MEIFKLFGSVLVETSGADKNLDKTDKKAQGLAGRLGDAIKTAGKWGAALVGAAAAAGAAVWKLASGAAEAADNIDKGSQKLGISSDAYQEWDAVLQHSGTSMSTMEKAMKTLNKTVTGASKDQAAAYAKIGLSMDKVQSMSAEERWDAVISGLQGMGEGADRSAAATALLGNAAQELGPLLNTSAKDTQAMRDNLHALGGVMSKDAVKAGAQFQDALQDLKTAFSGVVNQVGAKLLPALTKMMVWITDHQPEIEAVIDAVITVVGKAVSAVGTAAGTVIKYASNIYTGVRDKFNAVRSHVSGVVSWLKGVFNFSWSLPKIKLPHFTIRGGFSLSPPSVPTFGISWYKKAYDNAMLLNSPTIFGAAGGKLLGGGDGVGPEVVAGADKLMDMIKEAVSGVSSGGITVNQHFHGNVGDSGSLERSAVAAFEKMRWATT